MISSFGATCRSVVDALAAAGVPALITKGTALAYTVYPQPWLRPRTDTDLLVRHEDVPAASLALQACGYTRSDALSTGELVSHQYAFERTDAQRRSPRASTCTGRSSIRR